jgi:pteridine reductase
MEIRDRTALVTGAGRRVGRVLALALARAGANVAVHFNRSAQEAAQTVRQVEATGRRAVALRADLADADAARRLVTDAAEAFGRLDILVNNASLFEAAPVHEIRVEDWDRVLAVNLRAPFLLAQAAAPLLRTHGQGVIVNIADLSALQAWPNHAHHAVSKAGLVHLTRVLARALAPDIRVNCIAPGTVLPPEDYTEEQVRRAAERSALGRIGAPADVARALLFLVESGFVTGETVVVDGGRMVR